MELFNSCWHKSEISHKKRQKYLYLKLWNKLICKKRNILNDLFPFHKINLIWFFINLPTLKSITKLLIENLNNFKWLNSIRE